MYVINSVVSTHIEPGETNSIRSGLLFEKVDSFYTFLSNTDSSFAIYNCLRKIRIISMYQT